MPRSGSHSDYFASSPLSTPPASPQKTSTQHLETTLDDQGDVAVAMEVDPSNEDVYEVEAIVQRKRGKDGKSLYRIRWKGFSEEDDTWEPLEHIDAVDLIEAFEASNPRPINKGKKRRDRSELKALSSVSQGRAMSSVSLDTTSSQTRNPRRKSFEPALFYTSADAPTVVPSSKTWILPMSVLLGEPSFARVLKLMSQSNRHSLVLHPATFVRLRTPSKEISQGLRILHREGLELAKAMVEAYSLPILSNRAFPDKSPFQTKLTENVIHGGKGFHLDWTYGLLHWEDEFFHLVAAARLLSLSSSVDSHCRILVRRVKPSMRKIAESLGVDLVDIATFRKELS